MTSKRCLALSVVALSVALPNPLLATAIADSTLNLRSVQVPIEFLSKLCIDTTFTLNQHGRTDHV